MPRTARISGPTASTARWKTCFELQDKVATSVVGASCRSWSRPRSTREKQADRKPRRLRLLSARVDAVAYTRDGDDQALGLFYRAIELDPDFAVAYGWASWIFITRSRTAGWSTAKRRRRRAPAWPGALWISATTMPRHCVGGLCRRLSRAGTRRRASFASTARSSSIRILAAAWHVSGWLMVYAGEPDATIERLQTAMRLSPRDPLLFRMHAGMA